MNYLNYIQKEKNEIKKLKEEYYQLIKDSFCNYQSEHLSLCNLLDQSQHHHHQQQQQQHYHHSRVKYLYEQIQIKKYESSMKVFLFLLQELNIPREDDENKDNENDI